MSTNGLVESIARPAHAVWSNIHAGTSSQRSVSDPLNVQRKTTPPALSIVPWMQTRRPNHGCHRYKSSRKPVPWAFSNLVVQRRQAALIARLPTARTTSHLAASPWPALRCAPVSRWAGRSRPDSNLRTVTASRGRPEAGKVAALVFHEFQHLVVRPLVIAWLARNRLQIKIAHAYKTANKAERPSHVASHLFKWKLLREPTLAPAKVGVGQDVVGMRERIANFVAIDAVDHVGKLLFTDLDRGLLKLIPLCRCTFGEALNRDRCAASA